MQLTCGCPQRSSPAQSSVTGTRTGAPSSGCCSCGTAGWAPWQKRVFELYVGAKEWEPEGRCGKEALCAGNSTWGGKGGLIGELSVICPGSAGGVADLMDQPNLRPPLGNMGRGQGI